MHPLIPPLDVHRDEVIRVESLYDSSSFGDFFGPVAHLFGAMGIDTFSDSTTPTEAQKEVLYELRDRLKDVASHASQISTNAPLPRSFEDVRLVDPPALLSGLSVLDGPISQLLQLLSSVGIGADAAAPPTDLALSKPVIEKLRTLRTALEDVAANAPKPGALPINHVRSVEERSLQSIVTDIERDSLLSSVLGSLTGLLHSLDIPDITEGVPLSDAKKQMISELQGEVAEAVREVEEKTGIVHIAHSREEHEPWHHQNHHHEPQNDDHRPHNEHKHDGEPWEGDNKSRDAQKDDKKPHEAQKDGNWPHDGHKDGSKPHDSHKDGRKSPETHAEDRHAHNPGREGGHCQEPRDGQWDDGHNGDDCRHHRDGKDGNEDSSLLKIDLGLPHRA